MKIKIQKALNGINQTAGVVNAGLFTWQVGSKLLQWYHNGQHHHNVPLTDEQHQHLTNGGTLECEYGCGTVLRAREK